MDIDIRTREENLTVGRLLEKLQFANVNDLVCVAVQHPKGPPELVTLGIDERGGEFKPLFVWTPVFETT